MIITLKNANFSENNVGQLNSWFIFAPTVSGGVVTADSNNPSSIDKTTLPATTLKYTFDTAKYNFISCTPSVGTATHSNGLITVTIPKGTAIVANITISIVLERIGGEEEEETTNYTFTINPTPTSATVTLSATGYSTVSGTGSKSITVANGTKVNWSVSASGYTTRTGNWTIKGGNKTENITLTASSGDSEVGDGEWLSVLLTGDADAHNKFMNGSLSGAGSLSVGCDVIYAETNIQSLLEGKKIYKFASNGLGKNTITLYSNPYVGNVTTNRPEGRTEIGTVTSTSAQAIGTIVEYSVNNPSAIKENETLSISWSDRASGIKTVEGYNTPVYYLNGGVFKTKLVSFCSFDFYVGE